MWKNAHGFDLYEVNEKGEVRNKKTKHVISQHVSNNGYARVFLSDTLAHE